MKRTIIALVLLVAVCFVCFACASFSKQSAERIVTSLDRLESAYKENDTALCLAISETMINDFEIVEALYPYFGNHNLVHELSESLQKIPLWMQCGDDSAFYAEVLQCRLLSEEMSNKQQLLPENIF